MTKIKINDSSGTDDKVVSPTQNQIDKWVEQELAEAEQDKMLIDENPITMFSDSEVSGESID